MTWRRIFSSFPFVLLWPAASSCISQRSGCPVDGPLLPCPTNLTSSAPFQVALKNITTSIDLAVAGKIRSRWSVENTSFSIALVSRDVPHRDRPVREYHHRAWANVNGTSIVDGDTQYLIGSISKLFTDLLLLKTGVDFDVPIAKYLPELKNNQSKIDWESITLATLADHLAGIPPNYGFSETYYLLPLLEQFGFPPLDEGDFGRCGVIGLNEACTREGKLSNIL